MSREGRQRGTPRRKPENDNEPASPDSVTAGGWSERKPKIRFETFPGPHGVDEPVRVAMSREAYADLTAHAKEHLDREICGVLLGFFCEDDDGLFLSVEAIVRGEAAKTGTAHVTFTQETWNRIHEVREEKFAKHEIVGWYHTHPGFGVQFSEMDLFIQRHFFSGPRQIAFVTDPLGGDEAICVNTKNGIEHLSRFWVEGRERKCAGLQAREVNADGPTGAEHAKTLQSVEERLGQLIQAMDEQRAAVYRVVLSLGMLLAVGIVSAIGYGIYDRFADSQFPPEQVRFAAVPVQMDGETYLLGVQVVRWALPEKMESKLIESVRAALRAQEAEEERKRLEQEQLEKGQGEEDPRSAPGGSD